MSGVEVPVWFKTGLSVAEAAAMSSQSEANIRRLVARGVLARAPHTDRVIIARAELDRWLLAGRPESAVHPASPGPAVVAVTAWAEQPLSMVGNRR